MAHLPSDAPIYHSAGAHERAWWLILSRDGPVVGTGAGAVPWLLETSAVLTADAEDGFTWRPVRPEERPAAEAAWAAFEQWWEGPHGGHGGPYDGAALPTIPPDWLDGHR